MSLRPPEELIQLLESLQLARGKQVQAVAGRVRSLAGELPLFESIWVDALCQARLLTPFQAAQINAGKGRQLRVGNYLLCQELTSNGLGQVFVARDLHSGRQVRLWRAPCGEESPSVIERQLAALVQRLHGLEEPGLRVPLDYGVAGDVCWAACEHVEGTSAADWLVHNGRMPHEAVLAIARQMAAALAALEAHGCLHSDLGARQLVLTHSGQAVLPLPGLRGIVRPAEGYTRLDLLPEAFDYLAPERVSFGTPPDTASEIFACGCLWWHLLCGRPPLPGGDCLSKLRSAQQARIADARRYSPEAPTLLLECIAQCTQADRRLRPRSLVELAARLGPPEKTDHAAVARMLRPPPVTRHLRRSGRNRTSAANSDSGAWPAAVAAVLLVAVGAWWLGQRNARLPLNQIAAAPAPAAIAETAAAPPNNVRQPQGQETPPPEVFILTGEPSQLATLKWMPGKIVRSPSDKRTLVRVPPGGLVIDCDDVQLENLDFVPAADDTSSAAIIRLQAQRAVFRGCSFQGQPGQRPVAIAWDPALSNRLHTLPAGRLQLEDCVFHQVSAGLEVRSAAALRVQLVNCLHAGPGAWIRLLHWPSAEEPCVIGLSHCTLRSARCLLEVGTSSLPKDRHAEINIHTSDCVFVPSADGGLICLQTPNGEGIEHVHVSGQGSILAAEAPVAVCVGEHRRPQVLPDELLEAAGLVRCRIDFAGPSLRLPAASRAVKWQAPLVSPDAPGILEKPLYLPEVP